MRSVLIKVLILWLLGVEGNAEEESYANAQLRLIRRLTDPTIYDSRVRPVYTATQAINVTIRINLYQIVDISERQQYVMLYCWMTQMWMDSMLAWDPSKYSNISMVVLPYTETWLPDTYLYNNLAMVREESEHWINTILQMEPNARAAMVTFRYPALYKFACNMDVKYFPFDLQHCTMVFGSWTYDASGIDFFPEQEDVAREDFSESEEWTLLSFKVYRVSEKYACCPEPFSLLRLHLSIKRKPLHYIVNLIIPTVIISLISNVGFFTPTTTGSERSEKVNLGITTLLAFAILLLMVSDQMPTTSTSIPLIGWFLLGIMIQTSMATLATAVIMSQQRRSLGSQRLSYGTRRLFFDRLAPWLMVTAPQVLIEDRWIRSSSEERVRSASTCCTNSSPDISIPSAPLASVESDDDRQQDRTDASRKVERIVPNGGGSNGQSSSKKRVLVRQHRRDKEKWQLSVHLKKRDHPSSSPPTIHGSQSDDQYRSPSRREIMAAEYEWFSSILDRICLIASLCSVMALALLVTVLGYVKGT